MPEKTEDADGLAPIKDDNAFWNNSGRKQFVSFIKKQYYITDHRNEDSE